MANTTIGGITPNVSSLTGFELLEFEEAGGTAKGATSLIKTYTENNLNIPALSAAAALSDTDNFIVDQGAGALKATGTQLKAYLQAVMVTDTTVAEVDISSSSTVIDLTPYEGFVDGSIVRVSWTGGDSTYNVAFNTTFTMAGIAAATWIGHFKGGLKLRKVGSDWEVVGARFGSVWDLGASGSKEVSKYLDGTALEHGSLSLTFTASPSSATLAYSWVISSMSFRHGSFNPTDTNTFFFRASIENITATGGDVRGRATNDANQTGTFDYTYNIYLDWTTLL